MHKNFQKIITAAHCINSINPKSWKIQAGHLTRNDRQAQIRNVTRLYKHPRYNSRNNDNDITIMIVRHGLKIFNMNYIRSFQPKQCPPFEITGRVRPAAMPKEDLVITEGNLIITGMAHTENGTH